MYPMRYYNLFPIIPKYRKLFQIIANYFQVSPIILKYRQLFQSIANYS